jgi:hypothetical protein
MPWLLAQLLQDPEQSEERLLDEYYQRYFQEAAVPMRQFFEACEKQWMAQPGPSYWLKYYLNESQAVIFPAARCHELRGILDEASQCAASDNVRNRVKLVSSAFGVTERFVAFVSARDRVSRTVLSQKKEWRPLAAELRAYIAARREFIHYIVSLKANSPLVIAPFGWDDFLKNNPLSSALIAIHERSESSGEGRAANAEITSWNEASVGGLWPAICEPRHETVVERNGGLVGALMPARMIAGLPYGLSLPAEWFSKVEPSQYFQAQLIGSGSQRALHISGAKDLLAFQWNPVTRLSLHYGSVSFRGRVSPGVLVSVAIAWLDAREHLIGTTVFRLPEGDWTESITPELASVPPLGATWVGVGIGVQNQVEGDWIEAKDFRLRAN